MRDINKLAVSAALAVGLLASAFLADKAEANSHISLGIGFGVPVYVEPAAPVYYVPAPVYTAPPPVYYYPPPVVYAPPPPPVYYAPGYYYRPRGHLHWR